MTDWGYVANQTKPFKIPVFFQIVTYQWLSISISIENRKFVDFRITIAGQFGRKREKIASFEKLKISTAAPAANFHAFGVGFRGKSKKTREKIGFPRKSRVKVAIVTRNIVWRFGRPSWRTNAVLPRRTLNFWYTRDNRIVTAIILAGWRLTCFRVKTKLKRKKC